MSSRGGDQLRRLRRAAAGARCLLGLALCGAWPLCPEPACAGGGRDFEDGWVLSAQAAAELTTQPAAPQAWWFASGLARLYGMPELSLRAASAGWRGRTVAAALAWQRLGGQLFQEDRLRVGLLRGRSGRVGIRAGYDAVRLGDGAGDSCWQLDLIAQWRPATGMKARLCWPLRAAPPWHAERAWRRWAELESDGALLRWAVALDRDGRGAPALQGELAMRLADRCALGLRADPGSGTIGLTTAWLAGRLLLRTSHLVHPALGATHRWSLAVGRPEGAP